MLPPTQHETTATAAPRLPSTLRLGAVHLAVSDLDRAVAWYQDAIGLRVHDRSAAGAALGAGAEDLVVLDEQPAARPAGRHAGLFHLALLHDSRAELAHAALRLRATRTPIEGASDHGVSEALYLRDPDGNGVELYVDRPRGEWPPATGGERVAMFTAPLDIDDLLDAAAGEEARRHAGAALTAGHVHLHVGDIAAGLRFYRDVLGLELMASWPTAAFVAAGGYHHHLAFNVWQGQGVGPAPPDAVGLRRWTIVLDDAAQVEAVGARMRAAGLAGDRVNGGLRVRDPWGIELLIQG